MDERKFYCPILEGVTHIDRCLYKLSKVVEGNKICEGCVLRELEVLKRCGIKVAETKPLEKAKATGRKKRKAGREPKYIGEDTKQTYSTEDLSKLIGKSGNRKMAPGERRRGQ